VLFFRRRVRGAQSPDDATSIRIARERTRTTPAEVIPFFRGAYCYFIDINNDRRFPVTSGVRWAAAHLRPCGMPPQGHIGRHGLA
jgi:hypothetical protein